VEIEEFEHGDGDGMSVDMECLEVWGLKKFLCHKILCVAFLFPLVFQPLQSSNSERSLVTTAPVGEPTDCSVHTIRDGQDSACFEKLRQRNIFS
jgi:hypothetical protein